MLNCDTPPQLCDVSRAGQYANLLVSISELPSLEVDTVKTTHFWCGKVYEARRATRLVDRLGRSAAAARKSGAVCRPTLPARPRCRR